MFVVIFRAKIAALDEQYTIMAERMRELALAQFGCLSFDSYCEGDNEVALSYWPDEAAIKAWRQHPEHLEAQALGKQKWYDSYAIEIAQVSRQYSSHSWGN